MQYMAKWGPKGFLVSTDKVIPFSEFTTAFALKEDDDNDTSGKAKTNTRGRELGQVAFSTNYLAAAGTNPRAQIEEWKALLGKSYPLFIGNEKFGTSKMKLTKVDVSDVLLSNSGKMLQAKVGITLKEDGGGATSTKTSTTSKSSNPSKTTKKTTTTTTTGSTYGGSNSAMTSQAKGEAVTAEEEALLALGPSKTRRKTSAQQEAAQAEKEEEISMALAASASAPDRVTRRTIVSNVTQKYNLTKPYYEGRVHGGSGGSF